MILPDDDDEDGLEGSNGFNDSTECGFSQETRLTRLLYLCAEALAIGGRERDGGRQVLASREGEEWDAGADVTRMALTCIYEALTGEKICYFYFFASVNADAASIDVCLCCCASSSSVLIFVFE